MRFARLALANPLTRLMFLRCFFRTVRSFSRPRAIDHDLLVNRKHPNGAMYNTLFFSRTSDLHGRGHKQIARRRRALPVPEGHVKMRAT